MSIFSIDSDAVSLSSDSGISSGRTTPTALIEEDHPKSKSVSGRKSPIQEKLKRVSIPEVSKFCRVKEKNSSDKEQTSTNSKES